MVVWFFLTEDRYVEIWLVLWILRSRYCLRIVSSSHVLGQRSKADGTFCAVHSPLCGPQASPTDVYVSAREVIAHAQLFTSAGFSHGRAAKVHALHFGRVDHITSGTWNQVCNMWCHWVRECIRHPHTDVFRRAEVKFRCGGVGSAQMNGISFER